MMMMMMMIALNALEIYIWGKLSHLMLSRIHKPFIETLHKNFREFFHVKKFREI